MPSSINNASMLNLFLLFSLFNKYNKDKESFPPLIATPIFSFGSINLNWEIVLLNFLSKYLKKHDLHNPLVLFGGNITGLSWHLLHIYPPDITLKNFTSSLSFSFSFLGVNWLFFTIVTSSLLIFKFFIRPSMSFAFTFIFLFCLSIKTLTIFQLLPYWYLQR